MASSLRGDRYGTRADTAVFVACVVLSLIALSLPDGVRRPVSGALRSTVLYPLLTLEAQVSTVAESRQRLAELRSQRDSFALVAAALPALRAENANLRGLLGLGHRLQRGFVTAEVLHQAGVTDGLTLVLSAGRAQGVRELEPVVTAAGLVGVVRSVDPTTSVALAWTHPDFRASAMVEGRDVFGIVAARHDERSGDVMELRGVAYRDALTPGTPVVTSGLGGVFPRGVPIGTIEGVLSESEGWERTYLLRPAVHPAVADHVLILSAALAPDTLGGVVADTAAADTARPARRGKP